jgi:diacylglycerol kinase family enzyme
MYCYLYDAFIRDRRYESLINRIEARISELGLQGKVERLTVLKNAKEIVEDAIKKDVETFVIVGDDTSITKILNYLAGKKIILGIIPVGPQQIISSMLGIPYGDGACDTLSKRIVKRLDLGRANSQHFLVSLDVPKSSANIDVDGTFSISALNTEAHMSLTNFGPLPNGSSSAFANPEDGLIELVVSASRRKGVFTFGHDRSDRPSVFPVRRVQITCKDECLSLVADGQGIIKTPALVEVMPAALGVIVGRNRKI